MMKPIRLYLIVMSLLCNLAQSFSQTSWKGTVSTSWAVPDNWTAGVPTINQNAIIGDANFTGTYQPTISSSAECANLTIGGTVASTLTVNKLLTISDDLLVNSGSTLSQNNTTIVIRGDWVNSGSYFAINSVPLPKVVFAGTNQSIGGSNNSTFRNLVINPGSTALLGINVSVTSNLTVGGTINPSESPTYQISGGGSLTVLSGGTIKVNASTFFGNYNFLATLNEGSTVEYGANAIAQTISNSFTYSTLKISGSSVKTIGATLPDLNSSSSLAGNIFVMEGTLDMGSFSANRGTSVPGGTLHVANNATLKIRGISGVFSYFPANFGTVSLSLGSTVEYTGGTGTQIVSSQTYGNLIISSASGAAVKSISSPITVAGNFSSIIGTGTSVSCTADADVTVNGSITIGAGTTFNGSRFTHTIKGDWINNGTFTGSTSTVNLAGSGGAMSGSGINNFNNLTISGFGITATNNAINISGDFITSGAGTFTQASGGTLTMSGNSNSFAGSGISLDNFTIASGAVITSTATANLSGNLSIVGSFTASSGVIGMTGLSKTISGAGTKSFYSLYIKGNASITAAISFSITNSLIIHGTFSAPANTATFSGTTVLDGTANLANVVIASSSSLQLLSNAVLGIIGAFTKTGTLDVTSTIPNTVNYNGSGNQTIVTGTYHHLTLSNGSTKTANNNITVNGDLTIGTSTTFNAGASTYTHNFLSNFTNNGTFTPVNTTSTFSGSSDAMISGATTFTNLTINKSSTANVITLSSNVSVGTLTMTSGNINTGFNTLTITTTRSGNGLIWGTITRSHNFASATAYPFEGPNTLITFAAGVAVTSVTMKVTRDIVNDFAYGSSINRTYEITTISGTYVTATLRLHYEDDELNGNTESSMQLWQNSGSWTLAGKSSNNVSTNFVQQTLIANIIGRWTIGDATPNVVRWNGGTSAWNTAGNWTTVQGTPSTPPSSTDIVLIGSAAFTNQPSITSAVSVRSIQFGSSQAATLTIGGAVGSLTTSGNISGTWSVNRTHTINVGARSLTVGGDLALSDGTSNRNINLTVSTGSVNVAGNLTESGGANITFSNTGSLTIGKNFSRVNGTFTPSTSTVTYNGTSAQTVAAVSYNNLVINKSLGIASADISTINGNLTISAGRLDLGQTFVTVGGDVSIAASGTLTGSSNTTQVQGNWINNGTFIPGNGNVSFSGTSPCTISSSTFYNLIISKTSVAATLTGNINITNAFTVSNGTLDLSTYTANHLGVNGGGASVYNSATLKIGGTSNFPANYANYYFENLSNTEYNSNLAQTIAGINYGNLTLTGTDKTLTGIATIAGDITINSGTVLTATAGIINLSGNWINNGTFTPSTSGSSGAIAFLGANKSITGSTTFNKAYIHGSYTVSSGSMAFNDEFRIIPGGSYDAASGETTISADLTNKGTLSSSGVITFSGNIAQTISLTNALSLGNKNTVNFNGTTSPILRSANSYNFYSLNINNAVEFGDSLKVYGDFNIGSGGTLTQYVYSTDVFYGSFINNGTVNGKGNIIIAPVTSQTITLAGVEFTSVGTVIFDGNQNITTSGIPTFNRVIINNSGGIAPTEGWFVYEDFIVGDAGVFNAGGSVYGINGDFINSGTFNAGSSTIAMYSTAGSIYGSNTTTLYDLIINSSANTTAATNFNISHNLTNNGGTIDASLGKIIFTGNIAGAINGSSATYDLMQFDVNKSTSTVVMLASNLTNVATVNVITGVLDLADKTVGQNAASTGNNRLWVYTNALLKIGGTNSIPVIGNYTLDSLSTVEYYGSNQTISATPAYGNLTLSTGGTKLVSSGLTIKNNFTLSTATFDAANYTHRVGGNWMMGSGAFLNRGTVIFNGAAVQNISSTGAFGNVTVNKSSSYINLATDVTIDGILTFTLGKIYTGNNKLIMPIGTVNGAGSGTGWVNGNLQKNISIGSNITKSFEIGDVNNYSPISVLFANVSVGGNLLSKTTATEHPQIAGSGINSNLSINRYWTLITGGGINFTTVDATFNWVTGDVDAGAEPLYFGVGNYNGSSWSLQSVTSAASTSIQATGMSAVGEIAIGELAAVPRWTGAISTNWFTTGNWSNNTVPISTSNVLIPSSLVNYPTIGTGTASANNLTIQSGATVTVNNAILRIGGTVSNGGTFTASSGTIEFNGSSAQTIPASTFTGNTIQNLTINNAAGVTIAGTLNLTNALTISTGSLNTGGYLTLKSSATATAYVAPITSVAAVPVNGNVIVERYIPGRRKYRLITSSVTTSASSSLSIGQEALSIWGNWQNQGNTVTANAGTIITGGTSGDGYDQQTQNASLFTYDDVNRKYIGFTSGNFKNTKYTPLKAGVAYYMFVYGDRTNAFNTSTPNNTVLSATGTLLTGDQIYTTSSTIPLSNVTDRYTLLGNPFASPIDWTTIGRANLANTYWGWDPNLSSTGGYITVSTTGTVTLISPFSGVTGLNQYIQPGQGFFVKTTGPSPVLTIEEQDKVSNFNGSAFRVDGTNGSSEANNIPLLAVNLQYNAGSNTILADGVLTAFDPAFLNGVGAEDASKIPNTGEEVTIWNSGQSLSIDARKMPQSDDTIFLNIARLIKPQYTFQIFAQQLNNNLEAYLEDAYLHTSHLLSLIDTNYIAFTVNNDAASDDINRFRIVFKTIQVLPGTFGSVKATLKNEDIQVDWGFAEQPSVIKYQIERSSDNTDFIKVAEINAKSSNTVESYKWLDENAAVGNNYYRIRAIYNDGKFVLSKVVSVNNTNIATIKVYPNPVKELQINIELKRLEKARYNITLYNLQGQQLLNRIIDYPGGSSIQTINLSRKLPAGIYNLVVANKNTNYVQKIIID